MKIQVFPKDEAEMTKLTRYLTERSFTFIANDTANARSEEEAAAIANYCKVTKQSRFRRTKEELASGLSVIEAIEQRLKNTSEVTNVTPSVEEKPTKAKTSKKTENKVEANAESVAA